MSENHVPTNPGYVFEKPRVSGQYVNPVTLSNWLIRICNDLELTAERMVIVTGRLARLQADLRKAKHDLEDFEGDMLVKSPPPVNDRKTNKLLEAFVRTKVKEQQDGGMVWNQLRTTVLQLENDILEAEAEQDACRVRLKKLELQSDNIKTHLAYEKKANPGRYGR